MNVQHAPTEVTESRGPHSYARVPGRWLLLTRCTWLALVILTLAIYFASLPVYLAQLQTPYAGTTSAFSQQLSLEQAGALKGIGLSPGAYAAYMIALTLASVVVCLVVSTVIAWRRPDDRMALLVALMLVTFGPIIATSSVSASPSPWRVPNECLTFLALSLLVLVFLLFPTGHFVPNFMRWTLVVFLAGLVPEIFIAPFMPNTPVDQLGFLVVLGEVAALALVQVYTYRRVSNPLQRQQTKWVVFGLAGPATVLVGVGVMAFIFVVLAGSSTLYPLALNVVSPCLLLLIPLSFGFAILRSRLWDIDNIINRTLVYSLLTTTLLVVYLALVFGGQTLLSHLLGRDNGVVLVGSTLVVFVLFQPLRHHIQQLIDRRFYRRKYDATKIVAAFSSTLRNEVDLPTLSEHLLTVVQETMQPTTVSLWLVQREPRPTRQVEGVSL
jgi:hypothetical protein